MSQNPAYDSSIPVLTEVVLEPLRVFPEPAAEPADGARPAPSPEAKTQVQAKAQSASEADAPPAAERDWDALEARIAERVLAQLQPHIDAIVRNALASAGDQIHIGLRQAVEQAVAQQVAAVQFKG